MLRSIVGGAARSTWSCANRRVGPSRALPHRALWTNTARTAKVQSFVSTSHDPILNLSIEHYLYQTTPHDSAVLLLYRNSPCVVIGRNQNPWLELNLRECIDLARRNELSIVRRYSGGGTVFHDLDNVNWTVISPPASFTRDKHAEMVVRALRRCGVERARVNARHDIVLDQAQEKQTTDVDEDDMHQTSWTSGDGSNTRKCSGSAYKLTRGRALHHGTCLLNSRNFSLISKLLRSPAEGYINAKGVESISSPVTNTGVSYDGFESAVRQHFTSMYGQPSVEEINEEAIQEEKVKKSVDQMLTSEWTFGQTPRFEFTMPSQVGRDDGGQQLGSLPSQTRLQLKARHGRLEDLQGEIGGHKLIENLAQSSLFGEHSWEDILKRRVPSDAEDDLRELIELLHLVLPIAPAMSNSTQSSSV